MSVLFELRQLTLRYPGDPAAVLDKFDLEVKQGELLCLLGPSGCGKSTLLKSLAGLMPPEKGDLVYHPGKKAAYDRILILQQEDQLFPWLTVIENIGLPLKRSGIKEWRERSGTILEKVQIPEAAKLYPYQLSGGMRQRAVLGRALTADPETLLLDEPFAHLDAAVRSDLQRLTEELWQRENRSLIFVTHDIQEALILASRVVTMNRRGRLIDDRRIDIPRPRDPYDPEITTIIRQLRNLF